MKKLLFIFFIITNSVLFSQNFKQYNQFVNKAELTIIDSNYIKALYFYQKAFGSVNFPFASDYYNALLCATFTNNYDLAFEYMYKLIHKGIKYEKFAQNKYLKPLQNDERWNDFKNYYDKNRDTIVAGFNQELKIEFQEMLERDQAINRAGKNNSSLKYKFDSTIYANIVRIKEIIDLYGFPTEEMLGIDDFYDSPFNNVLVFHYFQLCSKKNENDLLEIFPILINAVKRNKLNYKKFFGYLADNSINEYASNIAYVIDTNIVFFNIDRNSVAIINENRNLLGIETIDESRKKVDFFVFKILKPKPIKLGQKEHDYMTQTYENIDLDYFIIGSGLFSHLIFKREDVKKYLDLYKEKIFILEEND